jgi:hypothetical protein
MIRLVFLNLKMIYKTYKDIGNGIAFTYPYNWEVEMDESLVSVYDPDGVGALQFSCCNVERVHEVDLRAELQDFLNKQGIEVQCTIEDEHAQASFDNDSSCWDYWLFTKMQVVVFASYNCGKYDMDRETKQISAILGRL